MLALVAYNLPTESLVEPLPNPFSYFTKEDPDPTNSASIQLLKLLPLPPLIILEKIIWQASQALLDGYKSIIYAHTSHSQTKSFSIVPMPRNQLATHYTLLHFSWRTVMKEKQHTMKTHLNGWMMNVVGEDNFDPDADVDLDMSELCWLTLHYRS